MFPATLVASQFETLEAPHGEPGVLAVAATLTTEQQLAAVLCWLEQPPGASRSQPEPRSSNAMNSTLDLFNLAGRLALITGSSAGIGLALARGLAGAGAHVVLNARSQDKLDAAAARLRDEGAIVHVAAFDVTDAVAVATRSTTSKPTSARSTSSSTTPGCSGARRWTSSRTRTGTS